MYTDGMNLLSKSRILVIQTCSKSEVDPYKLTNFQAGYEC